MSLVDEIRKFWDTHPCDFNKGKTFAEIDSAWLELYPYVLEELQISSDAGKTILEIGIGSGSAACASLTKGNPKRYIMVDISPETCKITGRHIREHYAGDNWDIFNYDAGKLPIPDNSIDRVKSLGVLHHIPHVEKVMSEIARVLKPGGDVVFMFYHKDSKRFLETWEGSHETMMACTDGNCPYTKLYTKQEITELLGKHGIKVTMMAEHEDGFALYVNGIRS